MTSTSRCRGLRLGTLGPGATNLVTAVADAFLDRVPLVALTDQGDLERMRKESHQYMDVPSLTRPIAKWNARVTRPPGSRTISCSNPEIAEVAVVGVPDPYRGESVKAFVVPTRGAALNSDDVITYARSEMAAYKYPRQVEIVSELPKTETGKIPRRNMCARTTEGRS